ncbi:hypothetical protein FKP32DRAFT_1559579, partial [Trametes sanguinea]
RNVLLECQAVIGGSAALRYLNPSAPLPVDYDLYVSSQRVQQVLRYLLETEEYVIASDVHLRDDFVHRPKSGVDFWAYTAGASRIIRLRRSDINIDIIVSGVRCDLDCPTVPIACSWTSLLMNYVCYNGFVCAYPTLTMRGLGLIQWDRVLHPSFPQGTDPLPLNTYMRRGFEFCQYAHEWDLDKKGRIRKCRSSWVCPVRERSFGDRGSLSLFFDGERAEFVGCGTVWMFGGRPCPYTCAEVFPQCPSVHVVRRRR